MIEQHNIVTVEFLKGIIGDGIRELDINDPYQCCAFVNLRFVCACCGTEWLGTEEEDYASWKWFKATAAIARKNRWYVAAPWKDGVYNLNAYCSRCASTIPRQSESAGPDPAHV